MSLIEIEAQKFIQNSVKNRNREGEVKSREEDKVISCDTCKIKYIRMSYASR